MEANRKEFFLVKKGTREEITSQMEAELQLTQEQSEDYFDFLLGNLGVLSEDEAIFRYSDSEGEEDMSGFMTDSMTYYVNLKKSGIYLIVFLINLMTGSVAESLLNVGTSVVSGESFIVDLEKYPEVRCVLLEMARRKKSGITIRELMKRYSVNGKERMECFNNHYPECRRKDGRCCLTEDEIREIVDYLEREGAVKKKGIGGKYYYQM